MHKENCTNLKTM